MGHHLPRLILLSTLVTILQCKVLGVGAMSIDQLDTHPSKEVIDQFKGTEFLDETYAEEIKHEGSSEMLHFEITSSRSIIDPPTVQVKFPNGVQDELELVPYKIHETSNNGCNYLGRLRNDADSSVAVTGCLFKPGDTTEITLISKNNINKMFSVDFYGITKMLDHPFEHAVSKAIRVDSRWGSNDIGLYDDHWRDKHKGRMHKIEGDEMVSDEIEGGADTANVIDIPSKLKAVIKFGYDEGWKSAFNDQEFDNWIVGVLAHTQAHYRDPSLGREITFEVQGEALYKSGAFWSADKSIYDAAQATKDAQLSGVTAMSWWCKWGAGNVHGSAYLGTLCSENGYNTNLNEANSSQSVAAAGFVLSHELGHNFGMSHDFAEKHGGKTGCCNNKGVMSYGSRDVAGWSECSKSDFEHHYSSRNWGAECLEDISDTHCKNSPPPTCEYTTCTGLYLQGACNNEWKSDPDKRCSDDTPGKVQDDCQTECKVCSGCACKDLLSQFDAGNCLGDENKFCYVEQPSTCSDLEDSIDLPGEKVSQKACRNKEVSTSGNPITTTPTTTTETECGYEVGSIVGGSVATPYSLPWQVGLVDPGKNRTWCGGTLIGPNHVLTAAHCMGYPLEIIVGEHDINDEEDGTRHEVCETTSHPEYNDVTVEYDFAIVRLSKPVKIGLRAMPACLPDKNDQRMAGDALAGETVTVSGWGNPSSNATNQNTLLHVVHVPAMTNQECSQTGYSTYVNPKTGEIEPIEIIDAMLCAGHTEGGIDACQGDSGGPLTYKAAGRTYIVGVVSFGIGCAEAAYPGVYARVTHVRDWIDEQLSKPCPKEERSKRRLV